ncbi:hypothetical protein BGZ57DRAFT_992433 [Hyaloscypha finlandica]|nr:hypothetical protein BGZ57DRAFT_992433 [Hyaloscypha finlandica]
MESNENNITEVTSPISIAFEQTINASPRPSLPIIATQGCGNTLVHSGEMSEKMEAPALNGFEQIGGAATLQPTGEGEVNPLEVPIDMEHGIEHGQGQAACLGLTCRRLYCCLKKTYSIPIRLDNFVDCDLECHGIHACGQWACLASCCCDCWRGWDLPRKGVPHFRLHLWKLLDAWMGSKYLLGYMDLETDRIFRFFNLAVLSVHDVRIEYNSGNNHPPVVLGPAYWRYWDWEKAGNGLPAWDDGFRSRLPSPFNKGQDWDQEATSAIRADITRFEVVREWRKFWRHRCRFFREHEDAFNKFLEEYRLDQTLDVFEDSFSLLGL